MKKILTVIGARPQFIKAATVSRIIKEKYQNKLQEVIVHTGQHYDDNMSKIFFDEMDIPQPDYNLNINASSHGAMTGSMIIELEKIMLQRKPDIILIYGDTNSTLAAAIAAAKLLIPIAHVEAGMRSFNKKMPEEINRILSDHVSDMLFCTTNVASDNLRKENIDEDKIFIVGDVMYDAVLYYQKKIKTSPNIEKLPNDICLVTCHRQENTDSKNNLEEIFTALQELAKTENVVIPLHPRTKKFLEQYRIKTDNLKIIEPVGYFDMLSLLQKAKIVLTDSGGLQKEAYYFKKPVVIMREETEWVELVDNNIAILTGANKENIIKAVNKLYKISDFPINLYGDGTAANKIIQMMSKK